MALDYNKITTRLLPYFLRRPFTKALIKVLISPIILIRNLFFLFQAVTEKKLSTNSQRVILESRLNDEFDPSQRRIKVVTKSTIRQYVHFDDEQQVDHYYYFDDEQPIDVEYIFFDSDSGLASFAEDFRVELPLSILDSNALQISAFINNYIFQPSKFAFTTI